MPNWWEAGGATGCVMALDANIAASFADSLLDLSGNGNDASDGVTPNWDTTDGWTFDGSQYLITPLMPATDKSWSAIVQFSGVSQGFGKLFGSESYYFGIFPYYVGDVGIYYDNGGEFNQSPGLTEGNLAVAGLKGYRNGVDDGEMIGSYGGSSRAVFIGASNSGTATRFLSGSIQRIAFYDNTLSAEQVAAIAAAMATVATNNPATIGSSNFLWKGFKRNTSNYQDLFQYYLKPDTTEPPSIVYGFEGR